MSEEKQRDHFQALIVAISNLQNCIKSMGPDAVVVEIRLETGARGAVERALKTSPIYAETFRYVPDAADALAPGTIMKIMGIALTETKSGRGLTLPTERVSAKTVRERFEAPSETGLVYRGPWTGKRVR